MNTKKNKDSGNDAKMAKRICGKLIERIFAISPNKVIPSKTIIEFTYKELRNINPSYAEIYASYSDYRIKVLIQLRLIRPPESYIHLKIREWP